MLKYIIVNNMHMNSNPTAPMVREANRGAVIQLPQRANLISAGEGPRGRKSHRSYKFNRPIKHLIFCAYT